MAPQKSAPAKLVPLNFLTLRVIRNFILFLKLEMNTHLVDM